MEEYYIHTFELYRGITFDEYNCIKQGMNFYFDKTAGSYEQFAATCIDYKPDGITVRIRKCTEKESKKGNTHVLSLIINTARLVTRGVYINTIEDRNTFAEAIDRLNAWIVQNFYTILPDICGLNDFKLQRFDITKDYKGIPEEYIQEIIMLMRRMPLYSGYKLNKQLENNTGDYSEQDSYDVINESRGISFTLYNKHKAAEDQNYPEEVKDSYRDTLRMELRCKRKYIKEAIKGKDTIDTILWLYKNKERLSKDNFYSMMKGYTGCCFISGDYGKKMVQIIQDGKNKRIEKMIALMKQCEKSSESIDEIGCSLFSCEANYSKIKAHFEEMGISPVRIINSKLAYIQSPESLLGFEEVSEQERKYYRMAIMGL